MNNEELETAKEELQATKEELAALNEELRNRNLELSIANNDLNNVIANVNMPILIIGGNLRIRSVNPRAAALLNLIAADIGRPITDLRSTLAFPGFEALISDSIKSMEVKERELHDHKGRWHSMRVRPYETRDGEIEGAVITLVDISEVKAEAIGARKYAEAIVETVRDSVLVLDAQLTVKAANHAFYEISQASPKDTVGHGLGELGNGQWNVPRLLELLKEILPRQTEVKDFQVEHEFPGIGPRIMLLNARRLKGVGNEPLTFLAISDVTEHRKADIALQQSEERFRLLVENVKDYAIFALDIEGRVMSWNAGAERIKGYHRNEIIGKHFSIFYLPADIAAGNPQKALQIAAAEGRYEDVENWRVRKDGSRFYANVVISAVRDRAGALRGFTKITRDITDRKRAQDELRQLSGYILNMQDEERRRIARDLHDSTAQVLTALSMNLSLVGRRPSVTLDAQASRLILESEALANQASAEVRNTSHMLHPPDLDGIGLVAAIRWYVARFRERSGISIKLNMPDDLGRLPQNNEIALFRVMQESLANVQRHSGSRLARIQIVQRDDEVDLEIADKGHGIPEGVRESNRQSVEGLGMGIAGMRERLEQLGGRLDIVSSPKGTKVKATLPCPREGSSIRGNKGPQT